MASTVETEATLQYLKDLWDDSVVAGLDEAELLRYRSNLLGADLRITNFAGGNTSSKVDEIDPLTGEKRDVLAKNLFQVAVDTVGPGYYSGLEIVGPDADPLDCKSTTLSSQCK